MLCIPRLTNSLILIPVAYKVYSIALSLSSICLSSNGASKIFCVSSTVSVVGRKNPDFGASILVVGLLDTWLVEIKYL